MQGLMKFHQVCKKQSKVGSLILTLLSSSTDALVFNKEQALLRRPKCSRLRKIPKKDWLTQVDLVVISDHDIQLASLTKSRKGGYYSEKGGKKQKGAGPSLGFMLLLHKGSIHLHVYIFYILCRWQQHV